MLNLLPQKEKEELAGEENYRLILILGILFLIFLISLFLILFSIKSYLWGKAELAKSLTDAEEKTFQALEIQAFPERIKQINQNLSKLDSFYQKQTKGTEIFKKISQILPSKMYLTAFSWEKDTLQVSLAGFSPTRETLFEFKKNLEQEKQISKIYFPPSNWIEPVDINFYLTFTWTQL